MFKSIGLLVAVATLLAFSPVNTTLDTAESSHSDKLYHLKLVKSDPGADAKLDALPEHIQFWFNQDLKLAVTTVRLKYGEEALELPAVKAVEDPKSFTVAIPDSMSRGNGAYTVQWATAGNDDHVVKGAFGFSVGE